MMSAADLVSDALDLAERGWHVLPLVPGGKRPLTAHGWHDAARDPAVIERWWHRCPTANVGVACQMSGLVVIDHDPRNGPDALHELERTLGELPASVECLTGRDGRHVYLRDPGGSLRGELAPGVDLKHHGYVLAPPSRTSGPYVWACDREPGEVELAAVPTPWLEAMRAPERSAPVAAPPLDGGGDPLLDLTPPEFFSMLAGVTPAPGGGFVSCPVPGHADAHPSCRVWPTVGGGWCCFSHPGGRVGGGVFQLAALLGGWPLPLRGADFLNVREALWEIIERRYGVAA